MEIKKLVLNIGTLKRNIYILDVTLKRSKWK